MTEFERRLVHASGSVIPLSYVVGVDWVLVRWFVLFGAALAVVLEVLRLTGALEWWVYDRLTREYEQTAVAGYALYAFGLAITAWLFHPHVAVPAMLMLTIADPISGSLSRGELGVKRSYVLLVTFAVCLAIASLLGIPFVAAVAGALVATVADGVTLRLGSWIVDDNLAIPVGAAAAMWLALLA